MMFAESKAVRAQPHVQSVARAFLLLERLNQRAVSSVDELFRETGLPKPTIVRLLRTLIEEGYVSNDPRRGGYQVTAQVNCLSRGYHGDPLIVEAARPWAIALTRQLGWPVSIAMLAGDSMTVRFDTSSDSPKSPFRASINHRRSLAVHALGLAYIAFCPDEERNFLIERVTARDPAASGHEASWLGPRIELTQERGFALRDPLVEPRNSCTVAVPVMQGPRVLATIGLTYFRSAVSEAKVREELAPCLRSTTSAIEKQIVAVQSTLQGSRFA
jgi:IclR family transcriptional regulator, mhp operon transcriptional activator